MKTRSLLFTLMFLLLVVSCKGQEEKAETKKESVEILKPEGSWKVNKEFDDNGNMIRYDSIYTWSSTGDYDKGNVDDMDSLMLSYRSLINNRFSLMENEDLSKFFLRDSIFPNDFNSQDLFGKTLNNNFIEMDSIRRHMERVRMDMLKNFFPEEYKK